MLATLRALGDDLANRRPDLPGANSPVQIVTHCCGVLEFWGGEVIADRPITRDRPAEFEAVAPVEDVAALVATQREQLSRDLAGFDGTAPGHGAYRDQHWARGLQTQGAVLMHIYEELAQHRGQLDISADLLRAGG